MTPLLEVNGLEVHYFTRKGVLPALRDVSLRLYEGEVLGIVGESGCGKSTTALAIMGLLPLNGRIVKGQIWFRGQDLTRMAPDKIRCLRGAEIAMIFQDPMSSLNPVLTIETQMIDILKSHPEKWAGRNPREIAVEMLRRVGIPDPEMRLKHYPFQFSGGMRQRIMIAMALMLRPSLLIADEPTSSLDVTLEAQILDLIKELCTEFHMSILFISHDLGVIAQICDRVAVMYAGTVVEEGDVFSVFDNPLHPYTQALLASHPAKYRRGERLMTIPGRVPSLIALPPGCKFAERCSYANPICYEQEPQYIKIDGRIVRCHKVSLERKTIITKTFPSSRFSTEEKFCRGNVLESCEWVLEIKDLHTYFFYKPGGFFRKFFQRKSREVRAVDGVSLRIARGEIFGLVGESGSGKTTLGKTILRLISPTAGEVWFEQRNITRLGIKELRPLRRRMQIIFQDPFSSLSPRLRVSELLTEPLIIHGLPVDPNQTVSRLLEMVGLPSELATKYPHQLSGGQARRVGIARALALNPVFLVADEPTSGLDVSVAAGILNLIKDLRDKFGLTCLIITHNLNIVGFLCDRIGVMYLGKLVELGPTERVLEEPLHPYTVALLSAIAEPDPKSREKRKRRFPLMGEIPSQLNLPPGCRFNTRCPLAMDICSSKEPAFREVKPGHWVACFRLEENGGER
ncbi:MAG: ABC transporter ATP-binding protein [Candidatus Bathyarchaeia archaeon]